MSINKADVIGTLEIERWNLVPRKKIFNSCTTSKPSLKKAATALAERQYQNFILKSAPQARQLFQKLVEYKNISETHIPLRIYYIFSNFIDEVIEHYQNQLDDRDIEIDEELINIKCLLVKYADEPWTIKHKELQNLLDKLKSRLILEDALPDNFDQIFSIWYQILKIEHLSPLVLGALLQPLHCVGAKSSNFDSARQNQIEAQCSNKEDRSGKVAASQNFCPSPEQNIVKQNNLSETILLSRDALERAYHLLVRQISKDSTWVFSEMLKKVPEVQDQESLRKEILLPARAKGFDPPTHTEVQDYIEKMKITLKRLFSLDLSDSLATYVTSDCVKEAFNSLRGDNYGTLPNASVILKQTSQKFQTIFNYIESSRNAIMLKNFYLGDIWIIGRLFVTLVETNIAWNNYLKDNTIPLLAHQITPLLSFPESLSASSAKYDPEAIDAWVDSLEKTSRRPITTKKHGKGKSSPGGPTTTTTTTTTTTLTTTTTKATPPTLTSTSTPELLRSKLVKLNQAHPSRPIQQTIWHLDSLIAIKNAWPQLPRTAEDCLATVTLVTQCSQKILEQTYRFCTKGQGEDFTTHNLKAYHRKYNPNFTQYPPVVKELFLAHHWCRSIYAQHDKWASMTTGIAKTPSILTRLFKLAEGTALPPKELDEFINTTIDNVFKQVEDLLKLEEKNSPQSIENAPLQLTRPMPLQILDLTREKLSSILTSHKLHAHHPVYLSIKQALAALSMQKTSLKRMNESQDIHTLSTWTTFALQQLHESIENVLHALEYLQDQNTTTHHELKALASKVKLEMGPLGDAYHRLSHKMRYPMEVRVDTDPAHIVDDLNLLKQNPEILDDFQIQGKKPSENASPDAIAIKLTQLMLDSEEFLELQVLPALKKAITSSSS